VIDHQDRSDGPSVLDQPASRLQTVGERLLDQDVLACVDHGRGDLRVRPDGCGDGHPVYLRVLEYVLEARRRPLDPEPTGKLGGAFAVEVAHPSDRASFSRGEIADEIRSPVPGADDGDPHATQCLSRSDCRAG
jgi:hypothetical protein